MGVEDLDAFFGSRTKGPSLKFIISTTTMPIEMKSITGPSPTSALVAVQNSSLHQNFQGPKNRLWREDLPPGGWLLR